MVTTDATILCSHGGRVVLSARQETVTAGGAHALREVGLDGAPVAGCPHGGKGKKPCEHVVRTDPGAGAQRVPVAGRPVLLDTLSGVTDSVPPGTIRVVDPGQAIVEAVP